MSRYTAAVAGVLGESHLKTIALVPEGATVLEIGPAGGYVTRALLDHGAAAVDCVELDPEDAAAAGDDEPLRAWRGQRVDRHGQGQRRTMYRTG